MKKFKLLLLALCALAFAACSSAAKSDSPQKIVKEYLDLCKAEKYDKTVKCFYFEKETKEAELEALAAKLKAGYAEKGGIDKYEIISEEITNDEEGNPVSARVAVKIYFKDGKEDDENMKVLKHDGEWKIDFSIK